MAIMAGMTRAELSEAQKVEASYARWWDSVRFRKGWSTPPVTLDEIRPLLPKAAEVVARVRSLLDTQDPTFKMRRVEGCSFAYFADLTPALLSSPLEVVGGIVHATFKEGCGSYTEGLTEALVDEFIGQCREHWAQEGSLPRAPTPVLKAQLSGALEASARTLCQVPDDESLGGQLEAACEAFARGQAILAALVPPHPQPASQQGGVHDDLEVVEMSDTDTETESRHPPSRTPSPPFHLGSACEEHEEEGEEGEGSESGQEDSTDSTAPEEGGEQPALSGEEELEDLDMEEAQEEEAPLTQEQIEAKQAFDRDLKVVRDEVQRIARKECHLKEDWGALEQPDQCWVKKIEGMQRRGLQISEDLMKATLSLDRLASPCPESRKERKEQVVAIQSLLVSVDGTMEGINKALSAAEALATAAKAERVRSKLADFTALCQRMEEGEFDDFPGVEPKLELEEGDQAYTVKSFLEGWPEGTVQASISSVHTINDTGVIKGSFYPTREFIEEIRQKGSALIEGGDGGALAASPAQLVEKVVGGRFGSFAKSFRVPNDAVWNQGSIRFAQGRLLLTIPKESPWAHGGMKWY